MPSLKNYDPAFRPYNTTFGPIAKATPDEIDYPVIYYIANPGTSNSFYFTGTPNGVGTTTGTPNTNADYPRNVLISIPGTVVGGSGTIYGKDQFGYKINESITVGTAVGGGTTAGTKIFASVGSVVWAEQGTGLGTLTVGYAVGTATAVKNLFGLPTKIAGTADCISITWLNGTVSNVYTQPWAQVAGSPNFTFAGTSVVVQSDTYIVRLNPRWDNFSQATYLMSTNTAGSSFG